MDKKEATWKNIEEYLATSVIEQAKTTAKRWFIAWIITLAALFTTNAAWLYVFNSYEYVYQDGTGQNNYNNDVDGNVENVVVLYQEVTGAPQNGQKQPETNLDDKYVTRQEYNDLQGKYEELYGLLETATKPTGKDE